MANVYDGLCSTKWVWKKADVLCSLKEVRNFSFSLYRERLSGKCTPVWNKNASVDKVHVYVCGMY
jgi:hypothetical protein